ncbi:polymorphic toxin type 23 domain-containing protein [Chryseobacterium culicis]|uniref:RHS repeat-associated core domain-containing protein n=1 Tax=Chryseobacterium culicis TaxID=680127 RepID=A0A1H6GZL0_CHRCI|nr:polymorphic toxin type 23 domain-containing protein [Chryseobacterium culicis]SEH28909.1 RHS repeat-associated core domain-containing protein [Chryseobacterium culicis]
MRKKLSLLSLLFWVVGWIHAQSTGQTGGELSVSPTGGASYSIPIATLPGIKNIAPGISLSYSSQAGNGIAGWGWNITGISSITRVASTKFHDGLIDAVNFNEKDRFTLDGQRLILKSGIYGQNGAEYQTENYSNNKIISYGYIAEGPEYFAVYYPDGRIAKYGYVGNFSQAGNSLEWKIVSIEDPQGNQMKFSYESINGYIYVKSIEYGNNSVVNPTQNVNKINFYYKAASRSDQIYIYSYRVIHSERKLDRIEILGNDKLFRKYQLTYDTTSLNYERLVSVQQFNGSGESVKPVLFEYDTTENGLTNNSKTVTSVSPAYDNTNWQYTSGYFDNDGSIDFMTYPNSRDKVYRFNSTQLAVTNSNLSGSLTNIEKFTDIFSTKLVLANNKFYNLDAVSTVTAANTGSTNLSDEEVVKINNYIPNNSTNSLDLAFSNYYRFENALNERCIVINDSNTYYSRIPKRYLSGDFDGDGVSDLLAITLPYSISQIYNCGGTLDPSAKATAKPPLGCCTQGYNVDGSTVYMLKLDPNNTAPQQPAVLGYNNVIKSASKLYAADFDRDNVLDIYVVNPGQIVVLGMKNGAFVQKAVFSGNLIKSEFPVYIADFNGDGKTDLITPIADANSNWYILMSNGGFFEATVRDIGAKYFKPKVDNLCYPITSGGNYPNNLCGYMLQQFYYTFTDINGDGKADMFYHDILTPYNVPEDGYAKNYPYLTYGDNYTVRDRGGVKYNMGSDINGLPNFSPYIDSWQNNHTYGGATNKGTPIFLNNPNVANQNLDYAFFGGDKIKYVSFKKDNRVDVTIKRIKENDLITNITYDTAVDTGGGTGSYVADNSEEYPYINLNIAPSIKLVKRVEKSFNGETKIQDYKYKGAVVNMEGLGFIGFKGLAVSTVYGGNITQPLWTVSLQDPQKRGAVSESFQMSGAVSFSAPSSFISKTINTYNTSLLPNKVFVNLPTQVQQIDNLAGVTTNQYYELYDTYYNPKRIRNVASGGEKITLVDYEDNAAPANSQYYIGRILKKTVTQTLGTDTYSTEEQYSYTGNLVTQTRKKGNNTDYITEDISYDPFGNSVLKTLSAPGMMPREEKMQYDPSGRFPVKSTDIQGTSSLFTYDTDFGVLLSKTNHLNQTISYTYDNWQRKSEEKDIYGNTTQLSYEWITSGDFSNGTKLRIADPTGAVQETITDNWGRKRLERALSINSKWIEKRTDYDVQDRAYRESDPYFSTSAPSKWTVTEFDIYGRVVKVNFPSGKIITSSYNGLSATVIDGQKTQTITKDEWGNKIKLTDNGGVITYSYYANGALKSTNYQGHIITVEQDGWGRKTKVSDPSVGGDYTYVYDNFGQLLHEINPKGKTDYAYDQFGRLAKKDISGDHTDIKISYTYDANGFLTAETGSSNGVSNSYTNEYDSFYRLKKRVEDNGTAVFTKHFTYDGFGRTKTEIKETVFGTLTSSYGIENLYASCGLLDKIKNTAGTVIWQLNEINEKGSILSAALGNGVSITNQYSANNFLQESRHINGSNSVLLSNTYDFEDISGLLNKRKNDAVPISIVESFGYDAMQRLISWTDVAGNQTQSYDAFGRIDNNSVVGEYKYESANRYRKKGINLNLSGDSYYSVPANQLQQISYNAYKNPVEITQDNNQLVKFAYNIHQTRSNSEYNYNKSFLFYGRHKSYSDDNTVEIIEYSYPGKPSATALGTRIITYVAGNPYSAPAAYIKDFYVTGQVMKEGLHYLHRDYQGTILAISDEVGKAEEKRHFDAWGNLMYLEQNGTKVSLKGFPDLMIERGYTGHEHFFQVGLIHMNGRMYDPKLHTFLSVDNFIQDSFNSQNYNRFGYVLNNPLMFIDQGGEFAWVLVYVGAIIGAVMGATSYIGHAIQTGNWNWGQFGLSILGGAVSGAIMGALDGGASSALTWGAIAGYAATGLVSGLMPSYSMDLGGGFGFSVSPSIAFGKGFSVGASFSVSYRKGDFGIAAGFGVSYKISHAGSGLSGWEYRKSIMAGTLGTEGNLGVMLGTNMWSGLHEQRTGIVKLVSGDFSLTYENDGAPFGKIGLGDNNDSYRTAAMSLSIGDFHAGFNLFTGVRNRSTYEEYPGNDTKYQYDYREMRKYGRDDYLPGAYGEKYTHGLVAEEGPRYRLGAAYVGWGNFRIGVNSEWIRHGIQNVLAHRWISPQPAFLMLSNNWAPYFQYQTVNEFTSW